MYLQSALILISGHFSHFSCCSCKKTSLPETDGNAILQVINQNIGEIGRDDDGNYLLKQSQYIT